MEVIFYHLPINPDHFLHPPNDGAFCANFQQSSVKGISVSYSPSTESRSRFPLIFQGRDSFSPAKHFVLSRKYFFPSHFPLWSGSFISTFPPWWFLVDLPSSISRCFPHNPSRTYKTFIEYIHPGSVPPTWYICFNCKYLFINFLIL